MRGLLILISLLGISFLATNAYSLDIPLGPEAPLSLPSIRSAPYGQHLAGMASNGWDFLAIWLDSRSTVISNPGNPGSSPLYVSRVDRAGKTLNPFGLKLRDAVFNAALVRTQAGYVVLWSENGEIDSMLLDDDGAPVTAPQRIVDGYLAGAAANGRTMLVIHGPFSYPQFASVFNMDGTLRSTATLDEAREPTIRPIVTPDGNYAMVTTRFYCPGILPCGVTASLTNVSDSGAATTTAIQSLSSWSQSAAAIGNGRLMVAWMSDNAAPPARSVSFRIFDLAGNPLTAARDLASTNDVQSISGAFAPSAGWDGQNFLVAWQWPAASEQSGDIRALRVTPDGIILDGTPAVLSPTLGTPPLFASNDTGQLIAWDTLQSFQSSDIAVRSAQRFDTLGDAATNLMPQSAALQTQVQLSSLGANVIAVWREGDQDPSIVASLSGKTPVVVSPQGTLDQQAPAAGASRNQYLVVWREQPFNPYPPQSLRILGKRVSSDGAVLDRDPIVIAQETVPFYTPGANTLSVGSDGVDFFVVWSSANDLLRGTRVSSAGALLDADPIGLSRPPNGTPGSPRVVWTGAQYVVAWTADPSCKLCDLPSNPSSQIFVARVSPAGKLIDSQKVWSGAYGSRVALAQGVDGAMLLVWGISAPLDSSGGCVYTMPLHGDGAPAGPARGLSCTTPSSYPPQYPDLDVAWDGVNFVAAWTQLAAQSTFALAMRVSTSGTSPDPTPFALALVDSISFQPALVTTSTGVLVAYDRIGTEPQYGSVARLFSRTLLRSSYPLRKRATQR